MNVINFEGILKKEQEINEGKFIITLKEEIKILDTRIFRFSILNKEEDKIDLSEYLNLSELENLIIWFK